MPKPGTDLQAAFVDNFVAGGMNATRAAVAAGYSERSAKVTAHNLLKKPHVQDAIRAEQRRVLQSDLATLALGVLRKVLEDEDAPVGARVDAAKTVLDRAGLVAQRVASDEQVDMPISQLSQDSLSRIILKGEARILELQQAIREKSLNAIPGEAIEEVD